METKNFNLMSFATHVENIVSCISELEELCVRVGSNGSTLLIFRHTVRKYLTERSQRDLTLLSLAIHHRKQLRANLLPTDDEHIRSVLAVLLVTACSVMSQLLVERLRNPPEHCNADAVVDALMDASRTDANATTDPTSESNIPQRADITTLHCDVQTNATLTRELHRSCPCALLHVIAFATDHALLLTEVPSESAPRSYRSLLLSLGAAVTDAMAHYTSFVPSHSQHGNAPASPLPRQSKRSRHTLQCTVDTNRTSNEHLLGGGVGACECSATAKQDNNCTRDRHLDALALPERCITSIRAQYALTVAITNTHPHLGPHTSTGTGTCLSPDASQWLLSRTTPSHLITSSACAIRVSELHASDPSFAASLQQHIRAGAPALLRGLVPAECMRVCGYDPISRPDTHLRQKPLPMLHRLREVVLDDHRASPQIRASTHAGMHTGHQRGALPDASMGDSSKYVETSGTVWRVGQFASLLGPRWVPIESGVYTHPEYTVHIAPLHRHWQQLAAIQHRPSTRTAVTDLVGQTYASALPCVAAMESVTHALATAATDATILEAATVSSSSTSPLSSAVSSQQSHPETLPSTPSPGSAPSLPRGSPIPYLAQHDIFSQCLSLSSRLGLASSLPAPLARAPTHAYALPASQAIALARYCSHVHWISAHVVSKGTHSSQSMLVGPTPPRSYTTHARANTRDAHDATIASPLWNDYSYHTTQHAASPAPASSAVHTDTLPAATAISITTKEPSRPRRQPLPWTSTSTESLWADDADSDGSLLTPAQAAASQIHGGRVARSVGVEVESNIYSICTVRTSSTAFDSSCDTSRSSCSASSLSSPSSLSPSTHTSTSLYVLPAELVGSNRVRPRLPLARDRSLQRSQKTYGYVVAASAGAVSGDALWEVWSTGVAEHTDSDEGDVCEAGDIADGGGSEDEPPGGGDAEHGVAGNDSEDEGEVTESWRAWAGPAGTYTPLHYDAMDNVLFQVVGTKRVLLLPPERVASMQKFCSCRGGTLMSTWRGTPAHSCSSASEQQKVLDPTGDFAHSLRVDAASVCTRCNLVIESKETFNTATVDEADARASGWYIELDLSAGDALFIPAGWWHSVHAYTPSLSFNYWWQ